MEYYKDDTCKILRSTIKIDKDTVVTRETTTMFRIKSGTSTLSLVAADEEECMSWVKALETWTELAAAPQIIDKQSTSDSDY